MSLRPLASLLVKMLGLYTVVISLPTISTTLFSVLFTSSTAPGAPLSPVTLALLNSSASALRVLFGIALWWFSDGIAQSAVPDDSDAPVRKDATLTAIGFSVLGAYLLSDSFVSLSSYVTNLYLATRYNTIFQPEMMSIGVQNLIPSLVQGALGLYLLFGARGLARVVASLKGVGRDTDCTTADAN